jgi:hypothetical protein
MRARTCSSSIPTSALIAGFACRNAQLTIKPDTEPGLDKWLRLNAEFAKVWPNITMKKPPPPDSKDWEGKPEKFQFFLPNPGTGD